MSAGDAFGKTRISFFQRCSPTLAPLTQSCRSRQCSQLPRSARLVEPERPWVQTLWEKCIFQSFECRYYSANTTHLQSVPGFRSVRAHVLDAVDALADIIRIHFRPKPSLSLTAVQSFSSSFFLLPYA